MLIWRGAGALFLFFWGFAWLLTFAVLEWSGLAHNSNHVLTNEAEAMVYLLAMGFAGSFFASPYMEGVLRNSILGHDMPYPGDLFFIPIRLINWVLVGAGIAIFIYVLFFDYFWLADALDAIRRKYQH